MTGPRRTDRGDETGPPRVWLCGQDSPRRQRAGRYLSGTSGEPDTMLPEIARRAITTYTQLGDVVGDPVCGIGTSLVEAAHLARHGVGIEQSPRCAHLARMHLDTARAHRAPGRGTVLCGDARQPPPHADAPGRWRLLLTRVTAHSALRGLHTESTATLITDRSERVLAGITEVLAGCLPLLAPGATVVLVTRDHHHAHHLINFPARLQRAAESVGLRLVDRIAAVRARITDHDVILRPSGYDLARIRAARAVGHPLAVVAHDDLLVFAVPDSPVAAPLVVSPWVRHGQIEHAARAA